MKPDSGCQTVVVAVAVAIVSVLGAVFAGAWWLEARFGEGLVLLVFGGGFGIICLVAGYLMSMANTRFALRTAAQLNHDTAMTERYRQTTNREFARGEREAFNARAKLDVIDAKRIEDLSRQRTDILLDAERQKQAGASAWSLKDDEAVGNYRELD